MKSRSIREVEIKPGLWSLVENWAKNYGFMLDLQEETRRIYRKGHGLIMAPACLEIRFEGKNATLEAWVKADIFLVMALMTGKAPEAALESGGLTAWLPRKRARDAVNPLLIELGIKPIT